MSSAIHIDPVEIDLRDSLGKVLLLCLFVCVCFGEGCVCVFSFPSDCNMQLTDLKPSSLGQ